MGRTILIYVFRFLMFAAVYAGVTLWWATQEGGHGALGIVGGGVILSGIAAMTLLAASILSRRFGPVGIRLFSHIVSIAIIFFIAGSITFRIGGIADAPSAVTPFTGIVIVAAIADGLVGAWLDARRAKLGPA